MVREKFRVDLHTHLHPGNYFLDDFFPRMICIGLNSAAFLAHVHQKEVPLEFLKIKSSRFEISEGSSMLHARDKETDKELIFLLGQEIESSDGWNLLSIGSRIDYDPEDRRPIESYIEVGLERGNVIIFDHPFVDPRRKYADIETEKRKYLAQLARKYGNQIPFEWNTYCLPSMRRIAGIFFSGSYSDINKELERFATEHDLRIVPTSDTHIRSRRLLNGIGTSYVEFSYSDLNFSSERTLCQSMMDAIMQGDYETHKRYASIPHFFWAFGWPKIKEIFFNSGSPEEKTF